MSNNIKLLFDLAEIPPRPTITQEMIDRAAIMIFTKLDIFDPDANYPTPKSKELAEQYEPHIDGYHLAKKLEKNCYWDICASDVEWLDAMDGEVDDLLTVEVKKWVSEHTITPPYPMGTHVKIVQTGELGVVTESSDYTYQRALYLLKMDTQSEFENSRRIVKYEDVTHLQGATK